MRLASMTLLALFAATAALAQNGESHLADVSIRSSADRIVVVLDTILDASAPSDGVIDQAFIVQTEGPVAEPISAELPHALVVHSARSLRITTATQRFEFTLDGASSAGTRVIGIAHHTGGNVIHLAGQGDCDSGGPGASSCALTTRVTRCDVECASGYYACAAARQGAADCRCVRDE